MSKRNININTATILKKVKPKYTQTALAAKLGISVQYMNLILRGRRVLNPSNLRHQKIAETLNQL